LELEIVRLAAFRKTEENIKKIEEALHKYHEKCINNADAVEEDMIFHLSVADAAQNKVLKSFMLILIPDIISYYSTYKVCTNDILLKRYEEHKMIFDAIVEGDAEKASTEMKKHLKDIVKLSDKIGV